MPRTCKFGSACATSSFTAPLPFWYCSDSWPSKLVCAASRLTAAQDSPTRARTSCEYWWWPSMSATPEPISTQAPRTLRCSNTKGVTASIISL